MYIFTSDFKMSSSSLLSRSDSSQTLPCKPKRKIRTITSENSAAVSNHTQNTRANSVNDREGNPNTKSAVLMKILLKKGENFESKISLATKTRIIREETKT